MVQPDGRLSPTPASSPQRALDRQAPGFAIDVPVLIFDGRCGFCTRAAEWVSSHLRQPVRALPYQGIDVSRFGLTTEQTDRYVWWVAPGRPPERGHRATAFALQACKPPWPWLGRLLLAPPVSWLAALGYHWVSKRRGALPGTTPACERAWDYQQGRPA